MITGGDIDGLYLFLCVPDSMRARSGPYIIRGSDQSQRPKLETPATKGKSKTRGIAENDFKVKAACASKALPIEKLDRETVPGNWIAQSTGCLLMPWH